MINTESIFYYGIEITSANNYLAFSENGGSEILAEITAGKYTLTSLATEIARAMNDSGTQAYAVNVDREARTYEIDATDAMPDDFELLVTSGSIPESVYSTIGFTGADKTGGTSYVGTGAIGLTYRPQMKLQNYVSFNDNQKANESSVHTSASGQVEVIKFGNYKLMECSIELITDIDQGFAGFIRTDLSGVTNARNFLLSITKKGPIEFIPDIQNKSVFFKCILESTPESSEGVSFRLKEEYSRGLSNYFSTGRLTFREVL